MKPVLRTWICFVVVILVVATFTTTSLAQQGTLGPSQKTQPAIDKLIQTPTAVSKTLGSLKEAGKAQLQETVSGKTEGRVKSDGVDLAAPKTSAALSEPPFSPEGKRDPFRPFSLKTRAPLRPPSRPRESLSPLERYELGQLKVVGIIWDIKEPRAMVEDTAGLGYIVKVGTLIGGNDGKVKAITRNGITVEEFHIDSYGARKPRDVTMKIAAD